MPSFQLVSAITCVFFRHVDAPAIFEDPNSLNQVHVDLSNLFVYCPRFHLLLQVGIVGVDHKLVVELYVCFQWICKSKLRSMSI